MFCPSSSEAFFVLSELPTSFLCFSFWPLGPAFRLASLGAALPSLPVDRTDPTGVASLAPAACGCEFPLLEFLSQALLSAIFPAFSALVGPSLSFLRKVSLNPSEFECPLLSSYVEPTVPSA